MIRGCARSLLKNARLRAGVFRWALTYARDPDEADEPIKIYSDCADAGVAGFFAAGV